MQITRKSTFTGKTHTMELDVTHEQITRYYAGELIQLAFPHLTNAQREFILTGVTAEEWIAVFGDGKEDDEDE